MVPYMSNIQRRWHDLLSIALQMHGFHVLWPCFATLGDTATWWQSEPCRRLQPKGRHPEVFQHTWVDSTLDDSINAVGLDPASSARAEMMKDNPPPSQTGIPQHHLARATLNFAKGSEDCVVHKEPQGSSSAGPGQKHLHISPQSESPMIAKVLVFFPSLQRGHGGAKLQAPTLQRLGLRRADHAQEGALKEADSHASQDVPSRTNEQSPL